MMSATPLIEVVHEDGYGQHVRGGDSRTALTEPPPPECRKASHQRGGVS